MKSPLVSVIVPMYNVEKYVGRCLESIRNQTFKDFEVIMINDGSPDNSAQIALEYAEKDSRFILINQENKGISGTRNVGIETAKGEYICFVDSDDFCLNDYIEKLYNAANENNADISCCVFSFYDEKTGKSKTVKAKNVNKGIYSAHKATAMLVKDNKLRAYLWNKMWRRELFIKNNIRFPSMNCFEDTVTAPKLMHFANKFVAIDDCCYYYVTRENSILTSATTFKTLNEYIITMKMLRHFFEENNIYHLYKRSLKHYGLWKKILTVNMLYNAHKGIKNYKGFIKNYISIVKCINYTTGKKYVLSEKDYEYTEIVKKY